MRSLKVVLRGIEVVLLGLLLGSLVGCSGKSKFFHDRSEDYVNAEPHPSLKIPAKMDTESFSDEYKIPDLKSERKTSQ